MGGDSHPWLPAAKPCMLCSCRVCSFRPDSVRAGFCALKMFCISMSAGPVESSLAPSTVARIRRNLVLGERLFFPALQSWFGARKVRRRSLEIPKGRATLDICGLPRMDFWSRKIALCEDDFAAFSAI